jgi:UDP-N-acetylmuramoylalanine--D-glutamate ligase
MMHLPTLNGVTAVFGLGRSGLACVEALLAAGNRVIAWDDDEAPRAKAAAMGATMRNLSEDFGADDDRPVRLVVSPGVPLTHPAPHPIVKHARANGCAILGDMDLFAMALQAGGGRNKATLICITGTNGKSTTTALIGHMLKRAGLNAHIGGNIGTPVLDLPLPENKHTIYVLELSSYQLDLNRTLVCDMGVMLNITPDHLDRHGDMTGYVAAKELLFANGNCAQARIIGTDTPEGAAMAQRQDRRDVPVTRIAGHHTDADIYYADGCLWQNDIKLLDMADCPALPGAHNGQNAAAALAIGRRLGLDMRAMTDSFTSFDGMAHRLQAVAQGQGLVFVNDSKATNAEATRHALAAYDNIYWIAGGVAKSGGLAGLASLYGQVRAAYLIGEAASSFADELSGHMPTHQADSLANAVTLAADQAKADVSHKAVAKATILLSPACASFDQFTDFEARGNAFCAAVSGWLSGQEKGVA